MASEVTDRSLEDARKPHEKDIRIWNLISFSGGATGLLYLRYRPLLDGPLFGAFGPFAMDGSMTPRSEMAGKLARWANSNPDLWKSRPAKGDIGIAPQEECGRLDNWDHSFARASQRAVAEGSAIPVDHGVKAAGTCDSNRGGTGLKTHRETADDALGRTHHHELVIDGLSIGDCRFPEEIADGDEHLPSRAGEVHERQRLMDLDVKPRID